MSNSSEGTSFRLFVIAWLSLSGVVPFLWITLLTVGLSEDMVKNIMVITPLSLFALLVYGYIKNKEKFFKWFAYIIIGIGAPSFALMIIAPLFMNVN